MCANSSPGCSTTSSRARWAASSALPESRNVSRLSVRLARVADDAEGWLEVARLRDERLRSPAAAATAYRRVLDAGSRLLFELPYGRPFYDLDL